MHILPFSRIAGFVSSVLLAIAVGVAKEQEFFLCTEREEFANRALSFAA